MADIQPFRGLRYRLPSEALAHVVAPPYDVIDEGARRGLLDADPRNIVAVDIAAEGYEQAAARWRQWRAQGIIDREARPALYGYKQTFTGTDNRRISRFGLMAAVKLASYEKGIVLPHERTLTGPKADRLQLMRATRAQLSPVFGLHFGGAGGVQGLLESVCGGPDDKAGPILSLTDVEGVLHELWVLTDPDLLGAMRDDLQSARIVIADGHHRYETALAFRDEQHARADGPPHAAWNYVQMVLVDIASPGLHVFPTHRILAPSSGIDVADAPRRLGPAFHVEKVAITADAIRAAEAALAGLGDGPGFVLYGGSERLWLVRLADRRAWEEVAQNKPAAWRELDVALVHRLALPKLGVDDARQSSGEHISYTHTTQDALAAVDRGAGVAALLLRPTPSAAVKDVALAGHNMPQKSTYYYPKLLTGLVMSDLDTPVGL